jgi:gas vesicle protein
MEKQSLIKYYWALLVVLVLLTGSNHAVAQTSSSSPSPTVKVTVTASPTSSSSANQDKSSPDKESLFPLIISILALVASGGAIALTILKNKEIDRSIDSLKKKYNDELKSLDNKYAGLLNSQVDSQLSQQQEAISHNSSDSNKNAYLEAMIERHSERISELENKLQVTQSNQQSITCSNPTYSSNQSRNQEPDFNPFNQVNGLSQANTTQPLENLAYIELVNTYNTNPKLLEQTAIKVSEPTDSINRRHSDSSQKIVLERANNSNYWVIHDVGIDCWLLPKSKLRIDQFRYETTKALFECHGYQPEYSTFKLVKPAKVVPLSTDEQTWQLEEPGILEFSVEA